MKEITDRNLVKSLELVLVVQRSNESETISIWEKSSNGFSNLQIIIDYMKIISETETIVVCLHSFTFLNVTSLSKKKVTMRLGLIGNLILSCNISYTTINRPQSNL